MGVGGGSLTKTRWTTTLFRQTATVWRENGHVKTQSYYNIELSQKMTSCHARSKYSTTATSQRVNTASVVRLYGNFFSFTATNRSPGNDPQSQPQLSGHWPLTVCPQLRCHNVASAPGPSSWCASACAFWSRYWGSTNRRKRCLTILELTLLRSKGGRVTEGLEHVSSLSSGSRSTLS